jgi:hypothetical protein
MLVRDMAVSSARVERSTSLAVVDLVRTAGRAGEWWDEDREMSIEDYGSRLAKDPSRIACGLMNSRHGCLWLAARWEALAEIARKTGKWDDAQRRLAFDMLGVSAELRPLSSRVPAEDDPLKLVALAEAQIANLNGQIANSLDALDASEREMAMMGMPMHEDKLTARLRKDEARARRDFALARTELRRHREGQPSAARPSTEPPSDRSLSMAAIDHLVKRSQLPMENPVAIRDDEVPAPPVAPPVVRGNRRYRKQQAHKARQAARQQAR